jgi:hypothetical protein
MFIPLSQVNLFFSSRISFFHLTFNSVCMSQFLVLPNVEQLLLEVPGSNLGPETSYTDLDFCDFPQSLQANSGIAT